VSGLGWALKPGHAVPAEEILQMVPLYETRHTGWTVTHFHER